VDVCDGARYSRVRKLVVRQLEQPGQVTSSSHRNDAGPSTEERMPPDADRKVPLMKRFFFVLPLVWLVTASAGFPPIASASQGVLQTACKFSHRGRIDPIVDPGRVSEHLHDFFGNESTGRNSTYRSMLGRPTSCDVRGDTAAYWAPTLLDRFNHPIPIYRVTVYYRDLPDAGRRVTVFPPNFRMVAGFPDPRRQVGPIKRGAYGWNCDNTEPLRQWARIDCSGHVGDHRVKANVFFPSCGRLFHGHIVRDSKDHRRHVVYPEHGHCPAGHRVKLPTVYYKIKYAVTDCIQAGCHLSSDRMNSVRYGRSLHADFWNTWNQSVLRAIVTRCLNGSDCHVSN
jgi:hypothetical protein